MAKTLKLVGLLMVILMLTSAVAMSSDEVAELTFWDMMWGPDEVYPETSENLVEEFNEEHPNIQVEVEFVGWTGFFETFISAVTGGAAPDVSTGAFPQAVQYANMNEILPLDPIIEEWEEEGVLDDFPEHTITLHRYDGIQAGIPWQIDPRQIIYRKDVFEEAGVEAEEIETWDDFIEACRKIDEETDFIPYVHPGGEHSGTHAMLNFMFTNNVGMTDEDGNATFNDSKVVEVLEFFGTLYQEGLVPEGMATYSSDDAERLYLSGRAAMFFESPMTDVFEFPEIAENSAILPIFTGPSGDEKRAMGWVNAIMAYDQTDYPEEARTFIKWWSENNIELFTEGYANFPVRESFTEDPFFEQNWLYAQITEQIVPHAVSPVWPAENLYPAFAQIEGEVYPGHALQEATMGDTDYEGIAQKYHERIEEALRIYGN